MASITRRMTNNDEVRYDVRLRVGQRVVTRTFQRKQDAERWASIAEADRARGAAVDPRAGAVAFDEYFDRWVRARELAPRTRELYRHLFARHLRDEFGSLALTRIAPEAVRLWHSALTRRAGAMQAAKAYRLLRAVLNTAVADDLLVRNPCRLPGAGQERSPERSLVTPQQVLALADAIDERYRALVLLAATGGLRLGELLGLRRSHVDLRAATVRVEEQATQMMSGERLIGPPKSAAGKRTISLPAIAVEALSSHVERFVQTDDEAYVFTAPGGAPLDKATLYRSWRVARTEVGLDHVTLHDLRHAGATLAAWTGASTKELMARLGHASPRAALRYQHAASSRDQEIARRLDAVFADARDGRAMETNGTSAQIEDQGLDLAL
ncbi:MAG: site-specific integrase [Actinomycetia bacterium]|nr:site-specific integrase [Actinomycetes bacterium]